MLKPRRATSEKPAKKRGVAMRFFGARFATAKRVCSARVQAAGNLAESSRDLLNANGERGIVALVGVGF